ncbi:MAG TPA: DUF6364 family protein [Bacillota bacterium]|nr:DUF6364 family protein [Bacillota bacterium]
MKNITISVEEDILEAGREYAKRHNMSLNSLIRKLLAQTVQSESQNWLEECFSLMDQANADSKGQKWAREELYDV